jgi:2-polyprenyl-3-methyl-5-hydroxy-6-metoxy-1,4-benzoquinol methylase
MAANPFVMNLHERYGRLSDQDWFNLLSCGWKGRLHRIWSLLSFKHESVPIMPAESIQRQFVGASGNRALAEAYAFYRFVKRLSHDLGRPITSDSKILDFGCGWGRIIRFFLKAVPSKNLVGVDIDPDMIRLCEETVRHGTYRTVTPCPPSGLAEASFDVIYAYSVFSHLSEQMHMAWVREFSRLLKPRGLLFATTRQRSFIEFCNSLSEEKMTTLHRRNLAKSFRPLEKALADYDAGRFLHYPTGGRGVRDSSFYGESAIPEQYIDREWRPFLRKIVFLPHALPQAVIVAENTD